MANHDADVSTKAEAAPETVAAQSTEAPEAPVSAPEAEGEAQLLVSEFPPPPYYYALAAQTTPDGTPLLTPPPIPVDALKVAAKKAAQIASEAAKAAEAERFASLGTTPATESASKTESIKIDGSDAPETIEGDVVAVFGEIVEDPMLVEVQDECENPESIRQRLNELNKEVLAGFVKLVNELVHNPLDNKKCRDEVSHNLFLMIQESNKYREHQARELLIDILEKQVKERRNALMEIQTQVSNAKLTLAQLEKSFATPTE